MEQFRYRVALGAHAVAPKPVFFRAHPALCDYVSNYRLREGNLRAAKELIPLYPRTEQFLEFYLRDRYLIRDVSTSMVSMAPEIALVGPTNRYQEDLIQTGELRVFTVHFHPTGFHRLFRLPMHLLAGHAFPAEQVLGSSARAFLDRLQDAATDRELVDLADTYLLGKLPEAVRFHPVHRAAFVLKKLKGQVDIGDLALRSGLSMRQFERQFREQVGFSPKMYARIERFQFALASKALNPEQSWTNVAMDAGFFDQAHLIREVRAFSNRAPRQLLALPRNNRWTQADDR